MKLKPDWLDQLSAAARNALDDTPEHGARTATHVLRSLRKSPATAFPWQGVTAGLGAVLLVAAGITLWPHGSPLPEVSAAALADLESAEWQAPSDALLADAATHSNSDLMREINQLLTQP